MIDERRPDRSLMVYYALSSLVFGPFFPIAMTVLYFRYHTLRYRFEEEGISMRWGILFRREISLTYSRIQDIHLRSNLVERWLRLGRVQIQTASGNAGAEMTIEGLPDFEQIRDFLYSKMRGVKVAEPAGTVAEEGDELTNVLRLVAAELRALREAMERPQ